MNEYFSKQSDVQQVRLLRGSVSGRRVYKAADGTIVIDQNKADICLTCGHCMAVCKIKSAAVAGISYDSDLFIIGLLLSEKKTSIVKGTLKVLKD